MEENFGGPVWHARGRGRTLTGSRQIVRDALRGVGDATLGEWEFDGEKPGVVHLQRRLSAAERDEFQVPDPYDIRGTYEEHRRISAVYREAPYLTMVMPFRAGGTVDRPAAGRTPVSARDSLFPDVFSDRVKTQLQAEGHAWLAEGATLAELVGLVETLGIDANDVTVTRGGLKQIHLEVFRG